MRKAFLIALATAAPALLAACPGAKRPSEAVNILLLTADDLSWDSVGAFGSPVEGITPNLDALAREGIRFEHAHVNVAACRPARAALMTGLYPHRNGSMGFEPVDPSVDTLPGLLGGAGYVNGILGKIQALGPPESFDWSYVAGPERLDRGRSPSAYAEHARRFFGMARERDRPFFLMANAHDPHRPFTGLGEPSRRYEPGQVPVPGFLPDLPEIRREIAEYASAVHRSDLTAGAVLQELARSGLERSTLVVFLSDNGMSFPFAKANCYRFSTRTPLIVRWPGRVEAGSVDSTHLLSMIDLVPTLLEACGLPVPEGLDGRSFLPLLTGGPYEGREAVFTAFHETIDGSRYPMRAAHDLRYSYIVNAWSGGGRAFTSESQAGRTWKAMERAGAADADIARRVRFFTHRVAEELYDDRADPHSLENLIGHPDHRDAAERLRVRLLEMMRRTGDPLLPEVERLSGPTDRD